MATTKAGGLVFGAAIVAALAVTVSCSEESAPPPEGGGSNTGRLSPGDPCSVDAECREGLLCHPTRQTCICTSDDACEGELKCQPITGLCVDDVPGCKADADCGEGSWCDEASRVCRALRAFCEPCEVDDECGGEARCLGLGEGVPVGFCGTPCDASGGCANPKTHCEDGQCVPNTTCEDITPCNPDTFQTCDSGDDCTAGADQICDPSIGQCVARISGCSFGQVCNAQTSSCEPVCTGDGDCQVGERCINSLCQAIAACTRSADCAQNKVCRIEPGAEEGECVSTCARSSDCPLNQICARDDDGRLTCRSGCASNQDCAPNERCDQGTRTCQGGAGICQINDVCSECQVCTSFRCVPAGAPYCMACAGSGLDADCGEGGICVNGRCNPPCPEAGCPKGFLCRRFTDANGNELARACAPNDGTCDTECQ